MAHVEAARKEKKASDVKDIMKEHSFSPKSPIVSNESTPAHLIFLMDIFDDIFTEIVANLTFLCSSCWRVEARFMAFCYCSFPKRNT